MQLSDVNVLMCAHREDAPEHERFAGWLLALTEADEPFAASEVVLAIEHGCELMTTDSDFARFPSLRWRHPFAATQPSP
jgi:predicted nucleic acid-binding protein